MTLTAEQQLGLIHLLQQASPLYAVLDAARNRAIHPLIAASGARLAPLYSGDDAQLMAPFVPYLVQIAPQKPLLAELVAAGWGDCWGVYLTTRQPFESLLDHLCTLWLTADAQGAPAYFRFYDPRVLRREMPQAAAHRRAQIFGDVTAFMLEGEDAATLLHLEPGKTRLSVASLTL